MPAPAQTDARNDAMTVKEFLARRWKTHRESFRASGFEGADGSFGFVSVDRVEQPPAFVVMAVQADGRIRGMRGDLDGDEAARGDLAALAARVLGGEIPSRQLGVGEALALVGLVGDRSVLAETSVRRFAEGIGDPRITGRLPTADLVRSEIRRFDEAGLARIRDAFDQDALKALGAVEDFQWRDYLFYAEPGEKGAVRRQAAEVYPLLATVMAGRPTIRSAIDRKAPLAEAIQAAFGTGEDGKPRLGKGMLSRLRGVAWPTGGIAPERIAQALAEIPPDWFPRTREEWDAFCDIAATVGTILKGATGLGVDVLYGGCGGKWVEFRERLAKAHTDLRPPEGTTEEDEAYFKEAIDWKLLGGLPRHKVEAAAIELVARLERLPERIAAEEVVDWLRRVHAPDLSREALRNACVDAEDMLDAFAGKVVLPLAASETGLADVYLSQLHYDAARAAAAKVLFSGKSAASIFEMSRHMHSQYARIMEAGGDEIDDEERRKRDEEARRAAALTVLGIDHANIPEDGWPPLSPVVQAPNGVYIVPLTDPRLLQDEGRPGHGGHGPRECADGSLGLAHCVGGYAGNCRNGHHILSMRELTGEGRPSFRRLSTAEIAPIVHGDLTLRVRQHRGERNGTPPERAQRAFEWYKEQVALGAIPLNYERIRQHLGAAVGKADDVRRACDYEWRERHRIEKAMWPWGQYVGKRYRKMRIDAFAAQPEIAEVAELINPTLAPRGP